MSANFTVKVECLVAPTQYFQGLLPPDRSGGSISISFGVRVEVGVMVGVAVIVGVDVGVFVYVAVGVSVNVPVDVAVVVGVRVAVPVVVLVAVGVEVALGGGGVDVDVVGIRLKPVVDESSHKPARAIRMIPKATPASQSDFFGRRRFLRSLDAGSSSDGIEIAGSSC